MTRMQKFLVLATAFLATLPTYFLAYKHYTANLTDWQLEQEVDVFTKTGSTKLQAYIDSMTVAGVSFVIVAAILLLAIKISKKYEQK